MTIDWPNGNITNSKKVKNINYSFENFILAKSRREDLFIGPYHGRDSKKFLPYIKDSLKKYSMEKTLNKTLVGNHWKEGIETNIGNCVVLGFDLNEDIETIFGHLECIPLCDTNMTPERNPPHSWEISEPERSDGINKFSIIVKVVNQ